MANLNYKRFYLKQVAVTVSTGDTVGTSSADPEIVNGEIVGFYPTANWDQLIDSIAITAATGVITVTLAAGATADNNFTVMVMKKK